MKQKGPIMTDEKLIAELRTKHPSIVTQSMFMADAADRIEALSNACKDWAEVSQSNYQRAKAAEARVETLLQQSAEHAETVAALINQVKELEMVVFGLEAILWSIAHSAGVETKEVLMEVARATLEVRGK